MLKRQDKTKNFHAVEQQAEIWSDAEGPVNTTSLLPEVISNTWHGIDVTWNIAPKMTRETV